MEDSLSEDGRKISLRDKIKKLMGTGIQVPWSSMPEVQSSGLLENLTENQLALEELKFCLIKCEVAFNIELVDLVNLCKRSVSWADPLPTFNRRTIASTAERIKRCSDGFLNLIEKHWKLKPTINLATLFKIQTDMAPQLQNFVTFCTHQEDLRSVFYNGMKSKPEIATASISSRMNIELLLLPLQHLVLFRYLLQDIRSELISMTNHLESFHCKRALIDVTKLLEDCYKVLTSLHGSKYVANLERLLDESVHSCDEDYYKKFCYKIPKECKNSVTERSTVRRSSSIGSSVGMKWKKSNQSTKTLEAENKTKVQCVKEHCKFFNHFFIDINNNQKPLSSCRSFKFIDSSKNEKSKLKRQKPVDKYKKNSSDIAEKHNPKSGSVFYDRISEFEVHRKNNNNLYKENNFSTKSMFIIDFPDEVQMSGLKERNSENCDHLHEHIYNTLEDKDTECVNDKRKLSNEKDLNYFTEVSSLGSSNILNRRKNNLYNNLKREDSCFENESEFIEDSESHNPNAEHSSLKSDLSIDSGVHLVENNDTSISASECNYMSDHDTSSNSVIEVSKTAPPKVADVSMKDGLMTRKLINSEPCNSNRFQGENSSVTPVKHCESTCHERPHENNVHSPYEEIYFANSSTETPETANSSNKMNQTFVSSYDFGHTDVEETFLTEAKCETPDFENDEHIYEIYQPMHESFRRKHNSISPSKFKKKVDSETRRNGFDLREFPIAILSVSNSDCVHEYEDVDVHNPKMRSESILSQCEDVPLHQAYRYTNVKVKKSVEEDNLYIEPDEHVYEEIKDYLKTELEIDLKEMSASNMEISKPAGSSERVRWVDIKEVVNSGLLESLDNNQIALQEAKYEVITSEASYFKSLIILDAIFISNPDLKELLTKPEHAILFSSVLEVKQCSQTFLVALLDDVQNDLMLNYLCKAISKFVESGAFQVYVECCANQININRTLEALRLNNPAFIEMLSKLENDPVCQSFTLQSFLTLPMQRVTRLPLLVEAIIRRIPIDVPEYHSWKNLLSQLQEVANECNEAIGKADRKIMIEYEQLKLMNEKIMTLNTKQQSYQKKKQQTIWNLLKIKK